MLPGITAEFTTAARRAVLTGVNQMSAQINEKVAEDLDTQTFEVTWHSGARDTHWWGGRVYTKKQPLEHMRAWQRRRSVWGKLPALFIMPLSQAYPSGPTRMNNWRSLNRKEKQTKPGTANSTMLMRQQQNSARWNAICGHSAPISAASNPAARIRMISWRHRAGI